MVNQEKKDLIVKLYLEGKTYPEIEKEVHASYTTIRKTIKDYEDSKTKSKETLAFEKFKEGYSPLEVKIELDISAENAAKYYFAYSKLISVANLFDIYKELGDSLPDFLTFYKAAKMSQITVDNMAYAINLTCRTMDLQNENAFATSKLNETRGAIQIELKKLSDIQWQVTTVDQQYFDMQKSVTKLSNNIDELTQALHILKQSDQFKNIEQFVYRIVNTVVSEQQYSLEIALIAVLKKVAEEPFLLQYLLPALPSYQNYGMIDLRSPQSLIGRICSEIKKFIPEVLEELRSLAVKETFMNLSSSQGCMMTDGGQNPQLIGATAPLQSVGERMVESPAILTDRTKFDSFNASKMVYCLAMYHNNISSQSLDDMDLDYWYYYLF